MTTEWQQEYERLADAIDDTIAPSAARAALDAHVARLAEDALRLRDALVALRDAVKASGKMNSMEYDALGSRVNNAILRAGGR